MSMSTHVVGFIEPDEKFNKMYEAYQACKKADVDIPDAIWDYFGGMAPDLNGMEVGKLPLTQWSDETAEGYELRVADIPKDVNVIRFYNSY